MNITKKLILGATAACWLSGSSAYAQIVIQPVLNVGTPVYAAPPPVAYPSPAYVAAPWVEGYDPHHRRHDYQYWRDRHVVRDDHRR